MSRWIIPSLGWLLTSCTDDGSRHVFREPPPKPPARAAAAAAASAPSHPEPEIGTTGPSARILGVRSATTGVPVPLSQITDSVDLLALVGRGPAASATARASIELSLRGSHDTSLVAPLGRPVPSVIAHQFRLAVAGPGRAGLPSGSYWAQVRLRGPNRKPLAESIPIQIQLRAR